MIGTIELCCDRVKKSTTGKQIISNRLKGQGEEIMKEKESQTAHDQWKRNEITEGNIIIWLYEEDIASYMAQKRLNWGLSAKEAGKKWRETSCLHRIQQNCRWMRMLSGVPSTHLETPFKSAVK